MKNACIVVKKNRNSLTQTNWESLTGIFTKNGYFFDELRAISYQEDEFEVFLSEAELWFDNLLLGVEKGLLQMVSDKLLLLKSGEFIKANKEGMGVYRKGEFTLFLTEEDPSESVFEFLNGTCLSCLRQKGAFRQEKLVLRAVGVPAELLEKLLTKAKRLSLDRLVYNYKTRYEDCVLEIFYDETVPRILTDDVLRLFATELEEYLYCVGDKTLEEQLVDILKLRGKRLGVAESFTGGGVGRRIVSVSGASEVYYEGLNVYNEQAKMKRLGVSEYALKSYGAVSDQTAYEMAAGLIAQGDVDISIATTGIAGPKSDRTEFPVGLAYIAVGTKESVHVYQFRFSGNREEITEKAINNALFLAYRQLKDI
jgi:nicotinamide-nucleotide amidase